MHKKVYNFNVYASGFLKSQEKCDIFAIFLRYFFLTFEKAYFIDCVNNFYHTI